MYNSASSCDCNCYITWINKFGACQHEILG